MYDEMIVTDDISRYKWISDVEPEVLDKFNWSHDIVGEGKLRHIADFFITERSTEKMIDIFEVHNYSDDVILYGQLIPESQHLFGFTTMPVKIKVINYILDFGNSSDDVNKGVWLLSNLSVHYKVDFLRPHSCYKDMASHSFQIYQKFMKLYDCLDPDISDGHEILLEGNYCPFTVTQLHELSQRKFSLEFVLKHKEFCHTNLVTLLDEDCTFMQSLKTSDNHSKSVKRVHSSVTQAIITDKPKRLYRPSRLVRSAARDKSDVSSRRTKRKSIDDVVGADNQQEYQNTKLAIQPITADTKNSKSLTIRAHESSTTSPMSTSDDAAGSGTNEDSYQQFKKVISISNEEFQSLQIFLKFWGKYY